jgi:hypothetical protein
MLQQNLHQLILIVVKLVILLKYVITKKKRFEYYQPSQLILWNL